MYSKTLEILKEAVPTARRMAILLGQANPVTMQAIESAVRGLKITVEPHVATEPEHLDAALAAIGRSSGRRLIRASKRTCLPTPKEDREFLREAVGCLRVYPFREAVEDGGFLSFGPSQLGMARQGASFVVRILKGAQPGRVTRRAADHVRAGHQPQDRQGARPDGPAVAAAASGPGQSSDPARPNQADDTASRRGAVSLTPRGRRGIVAATARDCSFLSRTVRSHREGEPSMTTRGRRQTSSPSHVDRRQFLARTGWGAAGAAALAAGVRPGTGLRPGGVDHHRLDPGEHRSPRSGAARSRAPRPGIRRCSIRA